MTYFTQTTTAGRNGLNKQNELNAQGDGKMKKLILMVAVSMMAVAVMAAGQGAWDKSAKDAYIKLYNEANYIGARAYLEGIDFAKNEDLKNQYVSFLLDLDRTAEGKKATSIDSAKTQVAVYATKTGLTDQGWIEYNVLAHLFASLDDKQFAYDYYKSLPEPNIATKRFAIKVCNALKKTDEAKAISVAIGDSK